MYIGKWYTAIDPNADPQIMQDARDIRMAVFVQEQSCPVEEEMDSWDEYALHAVIYADSTPQQLGAPVATARLYYDEGHWRVGRVACLQKWRGHGYGDAVTRMLLWRAWEMGAPDVHIHAQIQAQGFYEKIGFQPFGDLFEEAGIPHVSMVITPHTTTTACQRIREAE